jgi:predicted DNA-binding mobile mystery protein A
MNIQKLRLSQVERALRQAAAPPRPAPGWVHTIRTAIGMTTRQLASRVGVSQSTLAALEKSESDGRITLQSLRRLADALDCDLEYTLVPRSSLKKRIEERAELIAHNRVSSTLHSMRLEDQAPTATLDKKEIAEVKKALLASNWKQLWE